MIKNKIKYYLLKTCLAFLKHCIELDELTFYRNGIMKKSDQIRPNYVGKVEQNETLTQTRQLENV